jgi:hypothetical protein
MKNIYNLLFIFTLTGVLFAQPFTNVQIDNSGSPEEPSICMNPKNTNLLVAGANIDYYYYSANGGTSWTKGGSIFGTYQVWGDPCMSVDTMGNFYFFHLVNGNYFIDRMGCHKSTNNGVSYNIDTYYQYNPPRAEQDKEWVAVDWTHGPRGNWIYVTWTQFDHYQGSLPTDSSRILFTRSTNGGLNWLDPGIRLNSLSGTCIDNGNTMEGAVPAVGPNGEIYDAWAGPKIINSQYGIFFQKSTDGGNTWLSAPTYVCDQPGGWDYNIPGIYRANGLPITCCDVSNSPYRGSIYINWTDEAAPGDHDVKFIKSTNGGLTWSNVKRINDDPAGREQFFSWMTVDQTTGFIYIIFYDRRNTTGNNTDVYLARSTDGGNTFVNMQVSTSSFLPTSSVFFGDYTNITAANGHVRPIWTRLQSGLLSIWTAIIDFPVGVQSENNEIPKSFSLSQNYPNPFNPTTKIKFTIPSGNRGKSVQLKIYDILGKEVATIVNESGMSPGTYEIEWNAANYSSGIYFYTLKAGNFSETKKMILNK